MLLDVFERRSEHEGVPVGSRHIIHADSHAPEVDHSSFEREVFSLEAKGVDGGKHRHREEHVLDGEMLGRDIERSGGSVFRS